MLEGESTIRVETCVWRKNGRSRLEQVLLIFWSAACEDGGVVASMIYSSEAGFAAAFPLLDPGVLMAGVAGHAPCVRIYIIQYERSTKYLV